MIEVGSLNLETWRRLDFERQSITSLLVGHVLLQSVDLPVSDSYVINEHRLDHRYMRTRNLVLSAPSTVTVALAVF